MARPRQIKTLRGLKDVLPEEQKWWFFIEDTLRRVVGGAGYERILLPTLEEAELFIRSVGKETDIVGKEMYTFKDKSGNLIALRPEGTAGVVRAYIEHGMQSWFQPVKLYYFGPFFRYERPQAGRYREFYQFGFELLGDDDPVVDAQLIALSFKFYQELGLKDLVVRTNSLGSGEDRPKMINALRKFLGKNKRRLCADCKIRLRKNPLRVLDCKESSCASLAEEAGALVIDNLSAKSKEHFTSVLEYLDELNIPYELDVRLVRGLDYYTHTTYEMVVRESNLSVGGGGRYDELVRMLGGPATPATGFAGGVERTIEALKEQKVKVPEVSLSDVFVAQLGEEAKKKALNLIIQLEKEGVKVSHTLGRSSIRSQLRVADRLNVKFALIIGEQEVRDGSVILRDMEDSSQESVLDKYVMDRLKRKLARKKRE